MQKQTQNPDQDSRQNKNQEQPLFKKSPLLTMPKLVLIASFIVVFCAVLGAVGWMAINKPVKNQQPQVSPESSQIINSFTGTLIPGGIECPLFQTDNGTIYSLQGAGFEGFKYGDAISIKGEFVEKSYCMQGKKTIKLLEINYVKDETADWKTYRNEEYGFEFEYPLNYKINEKRGGIEISAETQKGEWLIKIDFSEGYNLSSKMGVSTFYELATDLIRQYYCIYQIEKYNITCTNNIEKKEFINKHGIKGFEFNIEEAIEDTYLVIV